jgi:hypothetical protein
VRLLNQFGQQLQYAQFMAGVNQAFPGGIATGQGINDAAAATGTNQTEYTSASNYFSKMLSQPSTVYTPTYTTAAQANKNQARGIYY